MVRWVIYMYFKTCFYDRKLECGLTLKIFRLSCLRRPIILLLRKKAEENQYKAVLGDIESLRAA